MLKLRGFSKVNAGAMGSTRDLRALWELDEMPLPWTVVTAQVDLRLGGPSLVAMRGLDGNDTSGRGQYLDVVENERLVFTDAFTSAREPSDKAFSVVTGTLEYLGGDGTQHTARVLYWSVADREAHEKMGFHAGWALRADQLAALVAKL